MHRMFVCCVGHIGLEFEVLCHTLPYVMSSYSNFRHESLFILENGKSWQPIREERGTGSEIKSFIICKVILIEEIAEAA